MKKQFKRRYEILTEKLKEATVDIEKYQSQMHITKKGVGMFFVLCVMAFTFIFLSSVFYKGWAFVLTSKTYFIGFQRIPILKGQTAIVSAYSTSSVSRSVVFELARKGCDVIAIIDPPDINKYNSDQIRRHLEYSVGGSHGELIGHVQFSGVDMSVFKSIKRFVKKLSFRKLDILVLNEDSFLSQYQATDAGIEYHFAANYLGPFLFTKLLLKRIKSSGTRVLFSTNYAYRKAYPGVGIRFDLLNKETKDFRATHAYGQSKLAVVSIVPPLNKLLQGTPATINSIYPGLVTENLMDEKSWVYGHNWFSSMSASCAALTVLYAASSPVFEHVSGKHIEPAGVIMDIPPVYQINNTMSNMLYKRSFTLSNQFFIDF